MARHASRPVPRHTIPNESGPVQGRDVGCHHVGAEKIFVGSVNMSFEAKYGLGDTPGSKFVF